MQSLYPLVTADFTAKTKQPVSKIEIFVECSAYDLCDFYGKNYLIEAHYSSGERQLSYSPVAAEFTAVIDNTEGLFHPKNTDSPFYSYLKVGRKMIFHTGFKKDGIDYLWQWFEGIISDVQIDTTSHQIIIKGFDYTQYLTEVKLKSPDNYWGSHLDTVTVADQAGYDMPVGCNGAYIAYLDGVQIYAGDYWIYDEGSNKFFFLPSKIPVADDIPLVIYYYTTQVPENVIADLLVAADLYPTQAAALANMDYTATGADDDIARVRFNTGVSVFYAIQKICERVDYEFYFKYDGTPLFKPIATVGASQFTFGKELISEFNYIENIDEVRNHIVIEGEEYSIYDELYRILDGTEIMYTLDDIPDGDPVTGYGRIKMTGITAGMIVVAGLGAAVTDRMFLDGVTKTNIEAWRHAGNLTLIDGGDIYADSVTAAQINVAGLDGVSGRIVIADVTDANVLTNGINTHATTLITAGKIVISGVTKLEDWRKGGDVTKIDGGQISTGTITADKLTVGILGSGNQLDNGNFEDWTAGVDVAPDGWILEGAGATILRGEDVPKLGNYYARMVRDGADCYLHQDIHAEKGIDYWKGRVVTFSCWTYAVVADRARISIYDGVGYTHSSYHTGVAGWEFLTVTRTIDAGATYVRLACSVLTGDTFGAFDGAMLVEGSYAVPYADKIKNWGHPSDYTLIDGGNIYTHSIVCDKLLVGSDANTEDTLDVFQGESDTQIFRLRSTSINHQITQGGGLGYDWGTHTDCYFYMRKDVAATGGVFMASFTEASQDISFELYAIYGAANTAKDGNASGAINFAGLKADPANHSYKAALANENIFCLKTKPTGGSYQAIFIVDEDGDVLYDGTIGAFQDEDDIELLKELEDILGDRISKTEMKKKDVFKKHKVVHVNEVDEEKHGKEGKLIKTGTKRLDRFISTKRLNMLLMGSIRQLNEKIEKLEARI